MPDCKPENCFANRVCKTFQDFIKIKSKKDSGSIRIQQIPGKSYCIEFHHVSFRYKGTETDAVKTSLARSSHTRVAIVGKNGAGKTTFVKLLCRLYEPTEGRITLNGVDIRDYCYEDYLALFSVVFQDFSLFSFPIGEKRGSGHGEAIRKKILPEKGRNPGARSANATSIGHKFI